MMHLSIMHVHHDAGVVTSGETRLVAPDRSWGPYRADLS